MDALKLMGLIYFMTTTEIKSVKQNCDIVKVISHFIELKRDGANYIATCPFHIERSKSFTVSQSKNIFKCFGCGKSGDVIDFVKYHKGIPQPEAVQWCADFENITIQPEYTPEPYTEPIISYFHRGTFLNAMNSPKRYDNNFIKWLWSVYPNGYIDYHVSSSKHWPGAIVFWYEDNRGLIRSGKIMQYDQQTGKRIKDPKPLITWAHKVLRLPGYNFEICLFGEHLLNKYPDRSVCIVESEKTAIIASIAYQNYIWLASGSLTNLTYKRCKVLKGRNVTLYPDVGAEERWKEKMEQLQQLMPDTKYSMRAMKSNEKGYDLCDYILDRLKPKQ